MRYWIGVAARDHVERGVAGGFCQLDHGKASRLRKMSAGDWIVYYSPRSEMRGGEPVQAFTAIGRIKDREPYPVDMGGGFVPWRRDVDFLKARAASVKPLVERLSVIREKESWGYVFRFGQIEIPEADFRVIAEAMNVADRVAA